MPFVSPVGVSSLWETCESTDCVNDVDGGRNAQRERKVPDEHVITFSIGEGDDGHF